MSKPTLVAIYARVSTSEQNPESQLLALREYAARRGFSIYKEYVDHVSGDVHQRRAKRQNDRAYRELMCDAARRTFDCVLVWKYDRFARSLSILVAALQQFSTLGSMPKTHHYRFQIGMLISFAGIRTALAETLASGNEKSRLTT
jgi:DNA invertase Pin-like site-specific DNA recombinase